jgi:hypothetical protein
MSFTEDDLTPEEKSRFQELAAAGDQQALMDFINELHCKYAGKAANFGDGVHRTCSVGGKKARKSRKSRKPRKSRKSRKSRKHKKTHKKRARK